MGCSSSLNTSWSTQYDVITTLSLQPEPFPWVVRPTKTINTAAYPNVADRVWSFDVFNIVEQVIANSTTATVVVIRFFVWLWCNAMMYMGTKIKSEPAIAIMNLANLSTKPFATFGRCPSSYSSPFTVFSPFVHVHDTGRNIKRIRCTSSFQGSCCEVSRSLLYALDSKASDPKRLFAIFSKYLLLC